MLFVFQVSMLQYEDGELQQESLIPMVDGGTEGFKGNARVILPGMTACVECTLDLYPPQVICLHNALFHLYNINSEILIIRS
jgi:molybdopterin/thiamine biosynthesis adenylyltransferase